MELEINKEYRFKFIRNGAKISFTGKFLGKNIKNQYLFKKVRTIHLITHESIIGDIYLRIRNKKETP